MTDLPDGLPALGTVLDGKYRVDGVLGVGGMGAVLEAMHLALEERVAIKVLLGELAGNAEVVGRFTREAWAAAKIKSENVARVHDVGVLPSGSPYLVMEYLEGRDLEQLQEERGRLPVAETVDYVLQACHALAEAHEQGIIHRDLKPGNLFRVTQPDGSPLIKVVDFGISKVGAAGNVTKTGTMMGSPVYMAPEQLVSSKDVDVTADVWSLGVILFELVAGRPPFDGETLPQLCTAVMSAPTPRLTSLAPEVPIELDEVLARCLEKSPEDRYPSLAELAAALAPFGGPKASRSAEYVARVLGKSTQRMGTPKAVARIDTVAQTPATLLGSSGHLQAAVAPTLAEAPSVAARASPGSHARWWLGGVAVSLVAIGVAGWFAFAPNPASDEPSAVIAPAEPELASSPTADDVESASSSPTVGEAPAPPPTATASASDSAPEPPHVAVAPPIVSSPPPKPQPARPSDGWGKHGRSR